jgi:hypothetical protein
LEKSWKKDKNSLICGEYPPEFFVNKILSFSIFIAKINFNPSSCSFSIQCGNRENGRGKGMGIEEAKAMGRERGIGWKILAEERILLGYARTLDIGKGRRNWKGQCLIKEDPASRIYAVACAKLCRKCIWVPGMNLVALKIPRPKICRRIGKWHKMSQFTFL